MAELCHKSRGGGKFVGVTGVNLLRKLNLDQGVQVTYPRPRGFRFVNLDL